MSVLRNRLRAWRIKIIVKYMLYRSSKGSRFSSTRVIAIMDICYLMVVTGAFLLIATVYV